MKPESIKAALLSYRSRFARSSKERQKTQTWIDFCNMRSVEQFKEAKEKIIEFITPDRRLPGSKRKDEWTNE